MTPAIDSGSEELGTYQVPARGWSRRFQQVLIVVLLCVAGLAFYLHTRLYWDWTEDDAFITYRYSQNVASGNGFVFNVDERVEGYSNYIWVLVGAAAIRSGLDPEAFTKIVGLIAGLICIPLAWLLVRQMRPGIGTVALLAPFYLAISPVLVQHSVAGLESSFFACVLCAALVVSIAVRPGRVGSLALVLLLLLIALSRPEGPLFAVLLLVFRARTCRREWVDFGNRMITGIKVESFAFAVFFAAYYAWRWIYFHAALPNTFFAKARGGLPGVVDGAQYTLDFMRDGGGVLFVALALLPMVLRRGRPAYGIALTVAVLYLVFIVVAGGDWMYHYRFFAHTLPILAALMTVGIDTILSYPRPGSTQAVLIHATVALVLLATFMGIGNTELRVARIVLPAVRSHNYLSQNYEELGLWFRDHTDPQATIAVSDVGAVGYFSKRRILDMFGLIDPHIARLRGRMHFKADPRYILSRQPDYIVLVSLNDQGAGYSFQRIPDYTMNGLPEFHEQYDLIRTVPQHWHNEFVLVYRRRGVADSSGGAM